MIVYLTGQPSAGKTTIARRLEQLLLPHPIVIDGDQIREQTKNFDYSDAGRMRNLQSAHDIALFLDNNGFTPIIAMVSPFRSLREELKSKAIVHEFHIFTTQKRERDVFHVPHYEKPEENFTDICTDLPLDDCIALITKKLNLVCQQK